MYYENCLKLKNFWEKSLENHNSNYIFVIDGASGFLAYELSNFLLDLNYKVILIGRSDVSKFKRKNILKRSNVEYFKNYQKIPNLDKSKSIFIHTAASTPNNNIKGDQNIFLKNSIIRNDIAKHILNNQYQLIINISSTSVYKNVKEGIVYENHKTLPSSLYGLSKLLSENQFSLISRFSSFTNLLHLILPAILSRESKGIFILRLIDSIKNNELIKINSKHALFNNLTTSRDIGKTILNFVENHESLPKELFLNMFSKDTVNLYDIISFLSEELDKKIPKIVYDSHIASFLIGNKQNYGLTNNSLLLDMIKKNLVGN